MYRGYDYYALTAPEGDPNAKEVVHGTSYDVGKYLDRHNSGVRAAANGKANHFLNGHYVYARLPEGSKFKKDSIRIAAKKPRPTKFAKKLKEVEWHLDFYKNTIVYQDPKKLLDALAEDGYLVSSKHEPRRVIKSLGGGVMETYRECWILELKSKIDISKE